MPLPRIARRRLIAVVSLVALGVAGPLRRATRADEAALPAALTDDQFWRMASDFSERAGAFQSDNLLSNERGLQHVIPDLARAARRDGVYLGVGPEQNFTYIAALRPKMAFIVDVRRGNFDLHLMYKALFEMSADRAEFVSRLFARDRPDGLTASSSAAEIFDAFGRQEPTDSLYSRNMRAIVNHLTKTHRFDLSSADLLRLQHIYAAISTYGPSIQYSTTQNAGRRRSTEPTYTDLMLATDRAGQAHGFLASEDAFRFVKQFETDNLLVPVIGNFAGDRAIRSIGTYLKARSATVSVFYLSNVEEYLRQDGLWNDFCSNVAALPIDAASLFIRAVRDRTPGAAFGLTSELGQAAADTGRCDGGAEVLNERTAR